MLAHDKELKLAKALLKFPEVVEKVTDDLCLHHLCEFAYELCAIFSEFYDACYCIEKNNAGEIVKINASRVLLAESTAIVLDKSFHILGLKPVWKL